MSDLKTLSLEFESALISVDRTAARSVLLEGQERFSIAELAEHVISAAFERIGAAWDNGDLALSQVYVSGRIAEEVVDEFAPSLEHSPPQQTKIAIALLDDYHMLGKRMVATILQASGYAVLDLGRVEAEELVEKVKTEKVEILLISTLMLRAALEAKKTCRLLKEANLGTKVIVGGAPFRFDPELWREVGADAMGYNAADAVGLIAEMMEDMS
ncbi:B12-binding domain-containing protein [Pseudomonadota bacterium]